MNTIPRVENLAEGIQLGPTEKALGATALFAWAAEAVIPEGLVLGYVVGGVGLAAAGLLARRLDNPSHE